MQSFLVRPFNTLWMRGTFEQVLLFVWWKRAAKKQGTGTKSTKSCTNDECTSEYGIIDSPSAVTPFVFVFVFRPNGLFFIPHIQHWASEWTGNALRASWMQRSLIETHSLIRPLVYLLSPCGTSSCAPRCLLHLQFVKQRSYQVSSLHPTLCPWFSYPLPYLEKCSVGRCTLTKIFLRNTPPLHPTNTNTLTTSILSSIGNEIRKLSRWLLLTFHIWHLVCLWFGWSRREGPCRTWKTSMFIQSKTWFRHLPSFVYLAPTPHQWVDTSLCSDPPKKKDSQPNFR